MRISGLTLKNYRSYGALQIAFSDGVNVLQGKNAAGKTNLLESIGYLSFGRSFRTQRDGECIREGSQSAYIKGVAERAPGRIDIEVLLSSLDKKSLKVGGQPVRRMGDLFGTFIAVVFSPEDLKTLKESPSLRRHFMDLEISKLKPTYFFDLQEYQKAMSQKNALLKSRMPEHQMKKLVMIFSEQMADSAERIIRQRLSFMQRVDSLGRDIHANLSGGEVLSLKYRCSAAGSDIRSSLLERMEKSLPSEIEQGFCLVGPHREDFSVFLNGAEIRAQASQGQVRTAMLAMKLATFETAKTEFGECPVLLLDDVFSELDEARQAALLEHARGAQCFITTAVPQRVPAGYVYTVSNGTVTPASS
jgi:DNA replication and repair protein RecF